MDYNDVKERIAEMDGAEAIKMLNTVAKPYAEDGQIEDKLPEDQVQALKHEFGVEPSSEEFSDGELARLALLVMAENPEYSQEIGDIFYEPDMRVVQVETALQNLDMPTLLFALKTSVNFERDRQGQTRAHVNAKQTDESVLKEYVVRLLPRMPGRSDFGG